MRHSQRIIIHPKTANILCAYGKNVYFFILGHSQNFILFEKKLNFLVKKLGLGNRGWAEAEKPRRCVGIADQKVFARPESFCAFLQNLP